MLDLEKFAAGIHDYIGRAIKPLVDQINALESRTPERGEKGDPGERGERGEAGATGEPGPQGLQGERGEKGEPGLNGAQGERGEKGEKGDPGPAGERGADGAPGKDGERGEKGERGERGERGEKGDAGAPGERGQQGIPGEKGANGQDGKSVSVEEVRQMWSDMYAKEQALWALDFERRAMDILQRCVDRIEKPKDGKDGLNGKDGRDGLNLEDFELNQSDDGRTITLSLVRGEARIARSFQLSHPIYKGIWRQGAYEKGDCVTFGGSAFIAQRATEAKPEADDSWKLFVKRGRDGRDGEKGAKGDPGPKGRDAVEGTQLKSAKVF